MKHYALLKLNPQADPLAVHEKLWKGFNKLDQAADWLNHPVIIRGCCPDDDFDMMVSVELDTEERLPEYLSHPITQKLEEKVRDAIASKMTFNHY